MASVNAPSSPAPVSAAPTTSSAAAQPFHTASLYVGDIHPDVTEVFIYIYIYIYIYLISVYIFFLINDQVGKM